MFAAFAAFVPKGAVRYLIAAAAAVAFVIAIYGAGYRAASKASQADELRRERDAALRDLRVAEEAAANAERLISEANRRSADARKRAEEYANQLPANGGCALTGDDLNRLRDIRNRTKR